MNVIPYIFGKKIGVLTDVRGGVLFEYDPKFVDSALEISPVVLPLEKNRVFSGMVFKNFNYLPTVFADSLPDTFGNAMMRDYFEKKYGNVDKYKNSLNRLLYMGDRGIGAIEYHPLHVEDQKEMIDLRRYIEHSRKVYDGKSENVLKEIVAHPSPAGARPKAFVEWNRKTDEMYVGRSRYDEKQDYEKWIVKFWEKENNELTKLEYVYAQVAKDFGIDMPDVALFRLPDENGLSKTHFAIKRFDILTDGTKLHQHTLGGLLNKRHDDRDSVNYDELLKVTQSLTADHSQVKEAFKRMIFNVIGKNCDDHSKNFSFLMDSKGDWRLSPAYDLVYSYSKSEFNQHYLKVNNKSSDITVDDFIALGSKYDLSARFVRDEVEACAESFCKFEHYANDVGLSQKTKDTIFENVLAKNELSLFTNRSHQISITGCDNLTEIIGNYDSAKHGISIEQFSKEHESVNNRVLG